MACAEDAAFQAFYDCGLTRTAAMDLATRLSPKLSPADLEQPSCVMYSYWIAQDHSFQPAHTKAQFKNRMRNLGFRKEIASKKAPGEEILPKKDARWWAMVYADYSYYNAIGRRPRAGRPENETE